MKRWFSGLLAALLLFTLTGCGLLAANLMDPVNVEQPPTLSSGVEEKVNLPVADPEDAAAPAGSPDGEAPEDTALPTDDGNAPEDNRAAEEDSLPENGSYTTKEDVALYIHTYGHLPDNFITKEEAQNLGWSGRSLEPYAPGMCIGGDRFGNYEGLLPKAKGRSWTECDIDTLMAGSRGGKRIVFSNDGLIYYTGDHYASFELLYGEES